VCLLSVRQARVALSGWKYFAVKKATAGKRKIENEVIIAPKRSKMKSIYLQLMAIKMQTRCRMRAWRKNAVSLRPK